MRKDKETLAYHLLDLEQHIGELALDKVHDGTLAPFVAAMRARGNKSKTINNKLEIVRRVLNLAARAWRDDATGLTWLHTAPLVSMLLVDDARPPYPLSWDEQGLLFPLLPAHLGAMALFDVNTGARDEEVCGLEWAWEQRAPELESSVFVLPGAVTKSGMPRVLVLNPVAASVIEAQRGKHKQYVFPFRGDRIDTMNNTGWQTARRKASEEYKKRFNAECPSGFRSLHVHDLRHTFGRRLRAAGVHEDTRADLLGHTRGNNVTALYSVAELRELVEAVQRINVVDLRGARALTVFRVA